MANIVNIVNFVRGKEPRNRSQDLTETIREEIKLNKKYGFKNTILFQYDALNQPEFQPLIKDADDGTTEFGFWFEVVEPLCMRHQVARTPGLRVGLACLPGISDVLHRV